MPSVHKADPQLDRLIDEITVDCHDEDEQLMGFANAFDEANFPHPGTVVGEQVEVLSVGVADRPELIATCTRDGRRYEIALLDVDVETTDASTSRLIAAYRRWAAYC
jgi:hypothetical protein